MCNSKIRKTVANLSIKAGNMIHLFPFMQTKYMTGCENYFLLLYHRHKNQSAYFDYWLFFLFSFSLFPLVDRMANNTSLGSPWPENFWGKTFSLFLLFHFFHYFHLKLGYKMYCRLY